jgi:hypothetical protein
VIAVVVAPIGLSLFSCLVSVSLWAADALNPNVPTAPDKAGDGEGNSPDDDAGAAAVIYSILSPSAVAVVVAVKFSAARTGACLTGDMGGKVFDDMGATAKVFTSAVSTLVQIKYLPQFQRSPDRLRSRHRSPLRQ